MAGTFDFDYRNLFQRGHLSRFVEQIWYARGTVPYARERISPTGSTVAVIVLGDPIIETADNGRSAPLLSERGFLIGPHVAPVINEPTGETHAVGIVTTPIGCRPVFGVDPARVRGQVVDLETVWPLASEIRSRLLTMDDPDEMLEELMRLLDRTVSDDTSASLARCERAVAALEAEPVASIQGLAHELGVSHAHLDREFVRHVGISPRAMSRLLRLRRLLSTLDTSSPTDWSQLASEHGWFDQSHLIRDFKRHTGVTPAQYARMVDTSFDTEGAGGGVGFVPEG